MKLKKIELFGFKSFADRTVLQFPAGIAGIVGPNGCGKSNIADAFRWVLGEQSAKSMRGNKMHDVIFSGTTKRKPVNLAEVALTFTDIAGILPTEYEELTVTRRIFRNGESEYLINRRPVRLKDVHDLFLDSGIGKNAFSIFEQGKIDQIINLSPLERRCIFEEAAGILRFLQRKKEALHRLEHTEQNIDRMKDIYGEVERQLAVLEQQAEKAKQYKDDKRELETLELALYAAKRQRLESRLQEIKEKESLAAKQADSWRLALHQLEINRQNEQFLLAHHEKTYQQTREDKLRLEGDIKLREQERQTNKEKVQELLERLNHCTQDRQAIASKQATLTQEIVDLTSRKEELLQEAACLEKEKNAGQEALQRSERELLEFRQQQQGMQKQFYEWLHTEKHLEGECRQMAIRKEHLEERKEDVQKKREALQKNLLEIEAQRAQSQNNLEALSQQIEEQGKVVEQLLQETFKTEHSLTQERKEYELLSRQMAELKGRQGILQKLQSEREGFSKGAKKLLLASSQPGHPLEGKIQGLYESFAPKEGVEQALSSCMRPYLHTLVVQDEQAFDDVLLFAKEHQLSDFSLFQQDLAPSNETAASEAAETALSNKVATHLLASHFLCDLFEVEEKKEAFCLQQKRPCACYWGRANALIDRKGVVFFAADSESHVFSRHAELQSLESQLEKAEAKRQAQEIALSKANEKLQSLKKEKDALQAAISQKQLQSNECEYSIKRLLADKKKIEEEASKGESERLQLELASRDFTAAIAEKKRLCEEAKTSREALQAAMNDAETSLSSLLEKVAEEKKHASQKEAIFQKNHLQLTQASQHLTLVETKKAELASQEMRLEKEEALLVDKQQELQRARQGFSETVEKLKQQELSLAASCEQAKKNVENARLQTSRCETKIASHQEASKQAEAELNNCKMAAVEATSALDSINMELSERYGVFSAAWPAKEDLPSLSAEQSERKIRALRKKLEEASDINMASIEEHENCRKRQEFLRSQLEDLAASKEELVHIITRLDGESRKKFREIFDEIRKNFQKNFTLLFKGGEADLSFTENADILEAGIEIAAKPPGKQMRSINLMSGGEKCLTAIALLFAIFEVKPAPFCILDEIDAPLDDSNVERFVHVVKQFADRCQFIIVTHNKRTMAMADVLFGVSMQEKGVSTLLSVEFSPETAPVSALHAEQSL